MKTRLFLLAAFVLIGTIKSSAQAELRRLPDSHLIFQVGNLEYTPIAIGSSPDVDYGAWFIEHWDGGLNFAKPWGSTNWGNYKLFLKDDNGFVGIGTGTPAGQLDIHGSTNPCFVLSSENNGRTYFGKATTAGAWAQYTVPGDFVIKSGGGTHNIYLHMNNDNNDGLSVIGIGDGANGRTFNVFNNGKVTIGTTEYSSDARLTVNGKIDCEEAEVKIIASDNISTKKLNLQLNNAADYVFNEDYNLKSLSEIESYINENRHLPGIPSKEEFKENGMDVSEMTNLLLEKIEELTLHMIDLEKENSELTKRIEILEK